MTSTESSPITVEDLDDAQQSPGQRSPTVNDLRRNLEDAMQANKEIEGNGALL